MAESSTQTLPKQ